MAAEPSYSLDDDNNASNIYGNVESPGSNTAFLGTASAQAQALLKALNDFIVPIVQVGTTKAVSAEDYMPHFVAPEAQEFLVALHKFILATFGQRNSIKVNSKDNTILNEEVPAPIRLPPSDIDQTKEGADNDASTPSNIFLALNEASKKHRHPTPTLNLRPYNGISREVQHQKLPETLRTHIRQHVFNNMPIRLLSFETRAGNIEISLLEKEEIIGHIIAKIESDFDGTDHWSDSKIPSKYAGYAILSHTWIHGGSGEVTYENWHKGDFTASQPGFQKLLNFCKVAEQDHGVTLGWMDTICINKESSAELDESIRSMYKWYRDSAICITYLAQTSTTSDMRKDAWFTRGWTLQELLAPRRIKFYTTSWGKLVLDDENDKLHRLIHYEIELATSITSDEIHNFRPDARSDDISDSSVSRRMQWAANRHVTREEDIAYSLMGIFDVSISIAYGEGPQRAFFRLIKKILASSTHVADIFNWAGALPKSNGRMPSSLLPSSPQHYLHRSNSLLTRNAWSGEPTTLTHLGLRVQVLLVPAISTNTPLLPYTPVGEFSGTVQITQCIDSNEKMAIEDSYSGIYCLLDKRLFLAKDLSADNKRLTFGILNFWEYATDIQLSTTSLAVALQCSEDPGRVTPQGRTKKIHTEKPIVFSLNHGARSPMNQTISKG